MKIFFVLAAAALIASSCSAAFAQDAAREPRYARGEAVVLLRVPEEIRASDDRRALFAAYCRDVAADAGAEAVYISPVYETSECATATFRSKLAELYNEAVASRGREGLRRLRKTYGTAKKRRVPAPLSPFFKFLPDAVISTASSSRGRAG